MPTTGPLSNVKTQVAAVNLDVQRLLNWGQGIILELIVVDTTQLDNWRVIRVFNNGFNRIGQGDASREGSEITYRVADLIGDLGTLIRLKDLHVRADGLIHRVEKVPPVASNQAQVYTLTCKIRTTRASGGFNNSK